MDEAARHTLLQHLGAAMSDISEACYYAGWLRGAEYMVPELCRRAIESGQPQQWGHGQVTPEQALDLIALAEQLGSWACLDDDGIAYVPFQPFPLPPHYSAAVEREQSSRDPSRRGNRA